MCNYDYETAEMKKYREARKNLELATESWKTTVNKIQKILLNMMLELNVYRKATENAKLKNFVQYTTELRICFDDCDCFRIILPSNIAQKKQNSFKTYFSKNNKDSLIVYGQIKYMENLLKERIQDLDIPKDRENEIVAYLMMAFNNLKRAFINFSKI